LLATGETPCLGLWILSINYKPPPANMQVGVLVLLLINLNQVLLLTGRRAVL
jgi:hypothetical protein